MTKDEALKLALEALENISTALREEDVLGSDSELMLNAITAIKEALDECDEDELIIRYHEMTIKRLEKRIQELTAQPEQEPVARVIDNGTPEGATEWIPFTNRVEPLKTGDLLYTHAEEPVAWGVDWGTAGETPCVSITKRLPDGGIEVLAVEHGPARKWVGLTRDEQSFVYSNLHNATSREDSFWVDFANAIEDRLKEKNT